MHTCGLLPWQRVLWLCIRCIGLPRRGYTAIGRRCAHSIIPQLIRLLAALGAYITVVATALQEGEVPVPGAHRQDVRSEGVAPAAAASSNSAPKETIAKTGR
jgi:hypothetical protein